MDDLVYDGEDVQDSVADLERLCCEFDATTQEAIAFVRRISGIPEPAEEEPDGDVNR